jgi:hypothetical protein
MIDAKQFRELLRYEPETGKLYWLHRDAARPQWNARYANREAFTALDKDGYRRGKIHRRGYLAHRIIWAIVYGEWPDQIDHIDGDKVNNRINNLRSVSHAENGKNQKRRNTNTSGVMGVVWSKPSEKWVAQIKVAGRYRYLGMFQNLEEAVAARRTAEREHGFHRNHGR